MAKDFNPIVHEAHEAGMAAGEAVCPDAMIVSPGDVLVNGKSVLDRSYYVSEGVCGFAWISFAGNTAFGRWAKKAGVARNGYPKGLTVWVGEFGQSMQRKEAYAKAYAAVLRSHGIDDAYSASRMD